MITWLPRSHMGFPLPLCLDLSCLLQRRLILFWFLMHIKAFQLCVLSFSVSTAAYQAVQIVKKKKGRILNYDFCVCSVRVRERQGK